MTVKKGKRSGMKKNYKKTLIACYLGFVTQAIAANSVSYTHLTLPTKA